MKNLLLLLLLLPCIALGQAKKKKKPTTKATTEAHHGSMQGLPPEIERTLKIKLAVIQHFVSQPGDKGEELFWQTKGKLTFGIVNYTEAQNPIFKELFISQYKTMYQAYILMLSQGDVKATNTFMQLLVKQEMEYRNLLTPEQLKKYQDAFKTMETSNRQAYDSYTGLFFSDTLLAEYQKGFR
ncbi:MAG: hypothetical protein RLZZ500_2142 [Bacteroidota bacterium]|jgi:hypothetical protein